MTLSPAKDLSGALSEAAAAAAADLPAIVGRNVRRLRTRQGFSLDRLAKESGVSRAMIGQIEAGKSAPTMEARQSSGAITPIS